MKTLVISQSPHIQSPRTTSDAMRHVVVALLPALAVGVWRFGVSAAVVVAVAALSCLASEWLIARFVMGRRVAFFGWAPLVTGLLLGMNLPSGIPLWAVVIGSLFAIGVGKMAFGGLGCNIFNPALVGRVFLLLSFPALMTSWPVVGDGCLSWADAVTAPTPLMLVKQGVVPDNQMVIGELVGNVGGSLGEVGAIAILLGLVYLMMFRIVTWHIPVSIILSVGVVSWLSGGNPLFDIVSGGLMLGAVFMATDYVTSPMTRRGQLLYGVMIGVITVVIRRWGVYPEGVSFAILIMNGATPLINRYVRPRPRRCAEGRCV
ncbi:RnfABCDGE type electron transport complex subunit D [Paramuribaculum intestinale]|uniref:RnfABCDGE type electron transport complex subunit D n=1 Tax=Paramuribaculum intestinale TaxID=2094151 RepID=UPI0025B63622|nr:RnfABCDGE type electron transport complex subunit D [Paramuribaculum intestinale]